MQTVDEILKYIKQNGVNVSELSRNTGILAPRIYKWLEGKGRPKVEDAQKLNNWYRKLDKVQNHLEEEEINYQSHRLALKNRNIDITIPFYDVQAIGGHEYGADMTAITKPTGTIDIGDLLRDSRAALRVYGNSMIPGYPPGCVVGLVEKKDKYIHPGYVYVIETGNDRYVKRLYYNDTQTAYVCASDNTQIYEQGPMKGKYFYPLFEIPIDNVTRLFDVTGVVKRNANTIIINE